MCDKVSSISYSAQHYVRRVGGQLIANVNNVQRPCEHVTKPAASNMTYALTRSHRDLVILFFLFLNSLRSPAVDTVMC